MKPELIEITTKVQAHFHLNNGEVLMFAFTDGTEAYVTKEGENRYHLVIQPKHGSGREYTGDEHSVDMLFEDNPYGVQYYVVKGAKLREDKVSILDKIVDKIRNWRHKDAGHDEENNIPG